MRRLLTPILAAAALVAGVAGCTPRDAASARCLDGSRPIVDVPADPVLTYPRRGVLSNGVAADARGSIFASGQTNAAGMKFHHGVTGAGVCVVGGLFTTTYDPELTPWDTWHNNTSTIIAEPRTTLIGLRYHNVGDAVAFYETAEDWSVVGMRVDALFGGTKGGYVHDDCIQNDGMNSGVVRGVKLDGCHVFLSSSSATHDGTGEVVEVVDSIVRLRPFYNSHNTDKYGFNKQGGFFKWWGQAPQLYVHDSVFRSDQRGSYGGNVNGFLALPPGSRCHDVTLVAKGGWGTDPANPTNPAWQQRDIDSWRSQCTNLRFAAGPFWERAVADWDAAHPPATGRGT
jgi:hypothetical protein